MSEDKSKLDWWQKPEHLDPKAKERGKTRAKSSPKAKAKGKGKSVKRETKQRTLSGELFWQVAIILVLGLVLIVSAHFALLLTTRHKAHRTVPRFDQMGLVEADSIALINDLRLVVSDSLYAPIYERGVILEQLPKAGVVVKPGRAIYVVINATQQQMVDVPYVAGRSLRQAKSMLEANGLAIERLIYEEDLATNYILSQSYGDSVVDETSALRVPIGSGMTLHVGLGEGRGEAIVPQLVGRPYHSARSAILEAGLNIGKVRGSSEIDATNEKLTFVLRQGVPADSTLRLGSELSMELTLYQSEVDSLLKAEARQREIEEMLEQEEQMITDSLMRIIAPESFVEEPIEEEQPKKERVRFEDLFN